MLYAQKYPVTIAISVDEILHEGEILSLCEQHLIVLERGPEKPYRLGVNDERVGLDG
jgi:hypothetical protein